MNEKYPRGKLNEDDKGQLQIAIAVKDNTVVVEFANSVKWIGLDKASAIVLAKSILEKAMLLNSDVLN